MQKELNFDPKIFRSNLPQILMDCRSLSGFIKSLLPEFHLIFMYTFLFSPSIFFSKLINVLKIIKKLFSLMRCEECSLFFIHVFYSVAEKRSPRSPQDLLIYPLLYFNFALILLIYA